MKKNNYQKPLIREVALQQQLLAGDSKQTDPYGTSREIDTSNLFSEEP